MMRGGFTLVELIVVLAVVAIMTSICIPAYFQENDLQLTLAVNQFVADLYQIQKLSAGKGTASLKFWNDANKGNYMIFVNDNPVRTVHLPRAVYFGADLGEVSYGNGWPSTGYTVLMQGRKAQHLQSVIISLSTGRIRVAGQLALTGGIAAHAF